MKLANVILGVIIILVIMSLGLHFNSARSPEEVDNFYKCLDAGYPIMESYPRQCSVGEKTFTEPHCKVNNLILTQQDALDIAKRDCPQLPLGNIYKCNLITKTYWIDLQGNRCNPACVISLENRTAEMNWRCTGLN